MQVEIDGVVSDYTAVPVDGEEYERVVTRVPIPLTAKILMGFPPTRSILRLDPVVSDSVNGSERHAIESLV